MTLVADCLPRAAPPALVPAEQHRLGGRAAAMFRAVAWLGGAKTFTQALSWLGTLIVARWLQPADYGTVGMAGVFFGVVAMVSEFGITPRVVTAPHLDRDDAARLNFLSVCVGVAGLLVMLCIAPVAGAFYSSPKVAVVLTALSSVFLISSFKAVPDGLLQREGRFRMIAGIESLRGLSSIAATFIGAAAGWGYWSLILGMIVGPFVATLASCLVRPCAFRLPDRTISRDTISFSTDVTLTRLGWYWYENADFLVVSRILGETAAGVYWIAWTIANIPVDKLGTLTGTVALSFFSAARNNKQVLRADFLRLTEGLAVLTFPACIGLAVVAPDFVAVALGPQWKPVSLPLTLLCFYAPVRTLVMVQPHLLLATGHRRFVTWNMFVAAIVMPIAFIVGTRWGLAGVASAWFLLYPVVSFALGYRSFRVLGIDWRTFFASIRAPLVSTMIMSGVIVLLSVTVLKGNSPAVRLSTCVAIGAVTYGACTLVLFPQRVRSALNIFSMKGVAV